MRHFKITTRLLVGFLLVSVLPILLLGTALIDSFETGLHHTVEQDLVEVADRKAAQIDAYLNERITDARLLAHSPEVRRAVMQLSQSYQAHGPHSADYGQAERGNTGTTSSSTLQPAAITTSLRSRSVCAWRRRYSRIPARRW